MCSRSSARRAGALLRRCRGQATVEAAFALPVVLVLVLLLLQPAIVLYDRMVMASAAAEGCRYLMTAAADERFDDFVRRRLGAVPEQALFHVHEGGCTWRIEGAGDEASQTVSVSIATELRPLPLIGLGAGLLGIVNGNGNLEVSVEASAQAQPSWVQDAELGQAPEAWVAALAGS